MSPRFAVSTKCPPNMLDLRPRTGLGCLFSAAAQATAAQPLPLPQEEMAVAPSKNEIAYFFIVFITAT
jgi:hypothetical protein